MIFTLVRAIPIGTKVIPDYTVKEFGESRGEEALVYLVPSRRGGKPSQKRIRNSEWEAVHQHLLNGGELTRKWFEQNVPDADADGTCAFRVTGEVLVLLGVARRADEAGRTKYVLAK